MDFLLHLGLLYYVIMAYANNDHLTPPMSLKFILSFHALGSVGECEGMNLPMHMWGFIGIHPSDI
jgi:hypothetical protein